MKQLTVLSICLVVLALQGKAWAEIYETKDAEGNTEFTDSPPTEGATEIDLPQTNIADAPAPDSEDESLDERQPAGAAPAEAPVVENNINIERDGYEDGVYPEDVYRDGEYPAGVDESALRRDDAIDRADPNTPREVGDSEAQMPREVGDRPAEPREAHRR